MIRHEETLLPIVILAIGAICMICGTYRGELKILFEKATNICLECIGIG